MGWEAVGAIGEVMGAAGVIVTLIYLALQLRQNTKSTNAAIVATHLQAYGDTIRGAGATLEAARTMRIGSYDPESLTDDQRSQYMFLQGQWVLAWDSLYALFQDGLLPESQWHRVKSDITNTMKLPGARAFYESASEILSPDFRKEVERLIVSNPVTLDHSEWLRTSSED